MNNVADMTDIQSVLDSAHDYGRRFCSEGKVASYIPDLAKANPGHAAAAIMLPDGTCLSAGDCNVRFTLQSCCKVVVLLHALGTLGEEAVFSRVNMEPTGDSFNSIVRLEDVYRKKPFNPFINAGAITVASMLPGECEEDKFSRFMEYARRLTGNPTLDYCRDTYESERRTGDKNRALAYMLKNNGIIDGDVEAHLSLYFKICSLWVNCLDLAYLSGVLAFGRALTPDGERLVQPHHLHITRSLMATCGLYDRSGEYAAKVGIPSKSGVGGGIIAAVPGRMGIGVFGPALDPSGNSAAGVKTLEYLSEKLGLTIY